MTSEKELRLSCDELKRVGWICHKCGAEQMLDVSSAEQNKLQNNIGRYKCGVCGSACDAALGYAIEGFKEFYKNANETLNKIFFRISINNAKEKTEL